MPTFDLAEVRGFAADLDTRRDRCDNGEGMECATLDNTLRLYAALCCEFREKVREWGRAVFAGRAAFDPAVEDLWLDKGMDLYTQANDLLAYGQVVEGPCYTLDGQAVLKSALSGLYLLLRRWVTPQLAVGPSARQGIPADPAAADKVRQRIEALPPLPTNWQPLDPRQRAQYRRLRNQWTS